MCFMLRATFSSIKPVGKSHCNFELSEKNSQCNMYLMLHVAGRGCTTRRHALPLPRGLGGHRGSPPPPFSSAGSGSVRLRGEADGEAELATNWSDVCAGSRRCGERQRG